MTSVRERVLFELSKRMIRPPDAAVPVASAVCKEGGRWCPWMTPSCVNSTARSMQFSSSRTFPGQW